MPSEGFPGAGTACRGMAGTRCAFVWGEMSGLGLNWLP